LAISGRRLVVRHNNQPIAGSSDRRINKEDASQGGVYGAGVFLFWGSKLNNEKNYKNKIQQRP
jgi:hypothetical protein